ncbi:MAG TPA: IS110 family transposase [Blastocatellia bacterium]|jgi:transposase
MTSDKYVGLDVHKATIVGAVHDASGKCLISSIIQTKADTIRAFITGLTGTVHVTLEEGTHAAWLFQLIKPLVAEVVVCNPRHNLLLLSGNKGDKVDANNLAHLLRAGLLKPVYHDAHTTQSLKQLAQCYETLVVDNIRVMNRIKALYRGRGIACSGKGVYCESHRKDWLAKLEEPGARTRAQLLYTQLDLVGKLRRQARNEMIKESRRHTAFKILTPVPGLGPVGVALILATVVTPFRFRTKRQFWTYVGLAVVTRDSAEYEIVGGKVRKRIKPTSTRGLNRNYNRRLKKVFKSAALVAIRTEPFASYYRELIQKGMSPEIARVNIARKLASIVLSLWKRGEEYDRQRMSKTA